MTAEFQRVGRTAIFITRDWRPGTHDVDLGVQVIESLKAGADSVTTIPARQRL